MKKTIRSLLVIGLFAFMLLWQLPILVKGNSVTLKGAGTKDDPFQIQTKEELVYVADKINETNSENQIIQEKNARLASYILMDDIDVSAEASFKGLTNFSGELFNGNNHVVTVNISLTNVDNVGFFGKVVPATTNVTLDPNGNTTFNYGVGTIISALTIKGTIEGRNNVGGLIGSATEASFSANEQTNYAYVKLDNCTNEATVKGINRVGGLVGSGNGVTIDNSLQNGQVKGGLNTAGIIGFPSGISNTSKGVNLNHTYNSGIVQQDANVVNPQNYVYFGSVFGYQVRNLITSLIYMESSGNKMTIHFDGDLPNEEDIEVFNLNQDYHLEINKAQNEITIYSNFEATLGLSETENYGVYANYVGQVVRIKHNNGYVYVPFFDRTTSSFRGNVSINLNELTHYAPDELANLETVENHQKTYVLVQTASQLEHLSWIINGNIYGENVAGLTYENSEDETCGVRQIGKISIKLDADALSNNHYDFDMTQSKGVYGTNNFYGISWTPFSPYLGSFDGNNQSLYIEMNYDEAYMVGLFGTLSNGQIASTQLNASTNYVENVHIYGSFKGLQAVSAVIAEHDNYAPGMIGYVRKNTIYVENVHNHASVTGKYDVGGILGYTNTGGETAYAHFTNVTNEANIVALSGGSSIGGIVGRAGQNDNTYEGSGDERSLVVELCASVDFNNVCNFGTIGTKDVSANYVGGLVGRLMRSAILSGRNTSCGNVYGGSYVGGLFGSIQKTSGSGYAYIYNDSKEAILAVEGTAQNVGIISGNNLSSNQLSVRRKMIIGSNISLTEQKSALLDAYLNTNDYEIIPIIKGEVVDHYEIYLANPSNIVTIAATQVQDSKNIAWTTTPKTFAIYGEDERHLLVAIDYAFILEIQRDEFSITSENTTQVDQDVSIITTSENIQISKEQLLFDHELLKDYGLNDNIVMEIKDIAIAPDQTMSITSNPLTINYQEFAPIDVEYELETTYNGQAQMIKIIDVKGELAEKNIQYRFFMMIDNQRTPVTGLVDAGTYDIEIEFYADDFMLIRTKTFVINHKILDEAKSTITQNDLSLVYDGTDKQPTFTVIDQDGLTLNAQEYTIVYANNHNVGEATATITFEKNYLGSKEIIKTFQITAKDLTNEELTITKEYDECTYDGTSKYPTLTINFGQTLILDTNYRLEYTNNLNAGKAQINIQFINNYTGSKIIEFTILPKDLTEFINCNESSMEKTYDGHVKQLNITLDYEYHSLSSTKYFLNEQAVDNILHAGTYKIVYTINDLEHNYIGTKTFTYTVHKAKQTIEAFDINDATIGYDSFIVPSNWNKGGMEYSLNQQDYSLFTATISNLQEKTQYTISFRYKETEDYEQSSTIEYTFKTLLSPITVQRKIDELSNTITIDDFAKLKELKELYEELDERYYKDIDEEKLLNAFDNFNRLTIYTEQDLATARSVSFKKTAAVASIAILTWVSQAAKYLFFLIRKRVI